MSNAKVFSNLAEWGDFPLPFVGARFERQSVEEIFLLDADPLPIINVHLIVADQTDWSRLCRKPFRMSKEQLFFEPVSYRPLAPLYVAHGYDW